MTPQLSFAGQRANLRLDAPERRNALDAADLRALDAALAAIDESDALVVVLSGTGDTFSAGYDLRALRRELAAGETSAADTDFGAVIDRLERLRVPTICALRGGAYGGGSDLALACDLRVGTPQTVVAVPAARFGFGFYHGGLRRYVERVGLDGAKRVFLTASTLDATELLRIGFLHRVVDARELDATIDALAAEVAANAPQAIRFFKSALAAIARGADDPSAIDEGFRESLRSPEATARLSAFRKANG